MDLSVFPGYLVFHFICRLPLHEIPQHSNSRHVYNTRFLISFLLTVLLNFLCHVYIYPAFCHCSEFRQKLFVLRSLFVINRYPFGSQLQLSSKVSWDCYRFVHPHILCSREKNENPVTRSITDRTSARQVC